MAGSYYHCVDDDGQLLDPERFCGMIENLGDAYEAIEEMYGMIWFLVGVWADEPDMIEVAIDRYKQGLKYSQEHPMPLIPKDD